MSTSKETVKEYIDKAVSVLNVAPMVLPLDKAPRVKECLLLTQSLLQTQEFLDLTAFVVQTVENVLHKV